MTFCKTLAEKNEGGYTITAKEITDKYSAIPRYVIDISKEEKVIARVPVARTTWKKRFTAMTV